MKVLNFSADLYREHLLCRTKYCTVRLGDKTPGYCEGDLVLVTQGEKFQPRRKQFYAVIDKVEVKKIKELTAEDARAEHPDFSSIDEVISFLGKLHKRLPGPDESVTVIYFSEILE